MPLNIVSSSSSTVANAPYATVGYPLMITTLLFFKVPLAFLLTDIAPYKVSNVASPRLTTSLSTASPFGSLLGLSPSALTIAAPTISL